MKTEISAETEKENTADTEVITIEQTFDAMFALEATREKTKVLGYIPSFFTTASLPFRNVNKQVFVRKGSNGITLTLTSPKNVPFGKYGRLLLSVLTTHAVLSRAKNEAVFIEYSTLAELLKEMQLPKQRGKDIREQLECFSNAAFAFEQKVTESKAGYLFADMYENGNYPKKDVIVTTRSTGNIRFTEGVQYQEIDDGQDVKFGRFKIILSAEFAGFCQRHAVPIDYTVYKEISSASGKDLYAWLVYRNNGIEQNKPVFIPRKNLVEQFMPVEENANRSQESVNYSRLIDELKLIKEKYYPEVKFDIKSDGTGVMLYKSPTPVLKDDTRYALITANI
ncbi:hypothetical protein HNP77_002293 [Treponema rectale]|uniref:Uncharacterized protein n=1 Tax=Treponema rectale TaxID=744512 RepID=A0A840SG81_9SPIR|nr:replication protein RepA [Treponema rectale]MBB5219904.1 hypothetical protein [Treponema rectale]